MRPIATATIKVSMAPEEWDQVSEQALENFTEEFEELKMDFEEKLHQLIRDCHIIAAGEIS